MRNVLELHHDLVAGTYQHGGYHHFKIVDPKPRDIHKASVRDRLLHHALYRQLYPFFDHTFISDSYSCRKEKGTHKAMNRFRSFARQTSKNDTRTCWVLKCDIRKFFASIDQAILMDILRLYVPDQDILWLIGRVVESFHSTAPGKGLPLGNLTSQLLVNIYMNKFDQFAKHHLKAKQYVRYADDFVFLSTDREWLDSLIPRISTFLQDRLTLKLHPDKVSIRTLASGVDFLGWVHFPDHRVLRTATKRRMFRALQGGKERLATRHSYLGMLSHGNSYTLRQQIEYPSKS
ncbi:MAG: reverse transcriptase/maturase family protein [Candidatus Kaiserbacteria bacterium]|nr:reverse transcriptase/maturase family protein [Candidatus Kaiserbacteria bacterium]